MSEKNTRLTIRGIFFTGILVTFPTGLTLFLFYWLATSIDSFGAMIAKMIRSGLTLPPGIGLIGTVAIIFGVGLVASNYFGKKIYELYEMILAKIPLMNHVFALFKKVFEMVLSPNRDVFRHAVLVEFPVKNTWVIGFLAQKAPEEFCKKTGRELHSVFVPTTPNPTSGVLLLIPKEEFFVLDMSIEEASKVIISGGIVTPDTLKNNRETL